MDFKNLVYESLEDNKELEKRIFILINTIEKDSNEVISTLKNEINILKEIIIKHHEKIELIFEKIIPERFIQQRKKILDEHIDIRDSLEILELEIKAQEKYDVKEFVYRSLDRLIEKIKDHIDYENEILKLLRE